MRLRVWSNLICEQQPTGDGGGSGGGGSLLTASGAGSGSTSTAGSANPGNSATEANAASSNSGAGQASQNGGVKTWRMALPEDLQEDETLRKFNDVPALAAAYINAQKLIGADKLALPGKNATDEDWANVFKKLGLPEDVTKYDLAFKDGATIDEEFTKSFKEHAFKAGILPKQAQALADWFSEVNLQAETKFMEQTKATQLKELDGLKQEWGKAYDAKLARAQQVLKQVGDTDFLKYLDTSGLGNDTRVIKFLAGVGEKFFKESPILQSGQLPTGMQALSPQEARSKANSIIGDHKHPYHLKDHPGHRQAIKEVSDLFAMIYSE